jgi:hypothetical protein
MRAAHERSVRKARQLDVVGIAPLAAQQSRILDPAGPRTYNATHFLAASSAAATML